MNIKGSKYTVIKTGETEFDKAALVKLIRKENIGVVIYDSVTAPFREFGSAQQNFPARADAMGYLYNQMLEIIDREKVIMFGAHHASLNPTNPFVEAQIRGGSTVKYFSKIILYMQRFRSKKKADFRKLHLVRYFDRPAWSEMRLLHYTSDGIVDITADEMIEIEKGA